MKATLLYATTYGKTRRVVTEVTRQLEFAVDVYNVKEIELPLSSSYELLVLFCPTYGDEELQDDMEQFLVRFQPNLSGKKFCVCELGNYYGYDDFQFGAMRIIRSHLLALRATEIFEPLSLDSYPRVPWNHLSDWVKRLNQAVKENGRR